jgi:hypothetical protein
VTIGYVDGSALGAILSPGEAGRVGASVWKSFDATCAHQVVEIEVPSAIGRDLNRVAWIWALNSLTLVPPTDEMRATAIDLAWLGAPPIVALHVAVADRIGVDHFVTADNVAASWAEMRGLNVVVLAP